MNRKIALIISLFLALSMMTACADTSEVFSLAKPEDNFISVACRDDEGNPVEGAMLVFCDDSTCINGYSDSEGIAKVDAVKGKVEVHVAKTPSGYELVTTDTVTVTAADKDIVFLFRKIDQ